MQDASLVHALTRKAFAEYAGVCNPPLPALDETLGDVYEAMLRGGIVLAWCGDMLVGAARYALEADHVHVGRVAVSPEARGCGVASRMLAQLEEIAREHGYDVLRLESRLNLTRNIALYERHGYAITDTFQQRADTDVQVHMEKQLFVPALCVLE